MTAERPLPEGVVRAGESLGIGNEFTGVQVRKVWTRQGERLELFVPRSGDRILLDAMQLEIVARQAPERFTQLFALSLGSQDAPVGGVPDGGVQDSAQDGGVQDSAQDGGVQDGVEDGERDRAAEGNGRR